MSREQIGTISPVEWREVLVVAREWDLEQGGYWDSRSGCVNLWCGPDDRPSGWPLDLEIQRGALSYPRAFVASIWPEWPSDGSLNWNDRETHYPVIADVGIYELARDYEEYSVHGLPRCEGDMEWLLGKWVELLEAAEARVPQPLKLRLGAAAGTCLQCRAPLRLILEVISSPWDNGVGDWRHYCPRCRMLTVPLEQIDFGARGGGGGGNSAIGHVFGVST